MNQPIKRHQSLQPLSRDHHQGLLLCWKIRKGFSAGINPDRIKKYADWFYKEHLLPHFELEEKYVFTVLDSKNENTKKALADHRRLSRLFNSDDDTMKLLHQIEEELEKHIRFEERTLFNEIQKNASPEQLQQIESIHNEKEFCDLEDDPFWL